MKAEHNVATDDRLAFNRQKLSSRPIPSQSTDWKYPYWNVVRNILDCLSSCLRIIVVLRESLIEGGPTLQPTKRRVTVVVN
jgi:hypothetical protein